MKLNIKERKKKNRRKRHRIQSDKGRMYYAQLSSTQNHFSWKMFQIKNTFLEARKVLSVVSCLLNSRRPAREQASFRHLPRRLPVREPDSVGQPDGPASQPASQPVTQSGPAQLVGPTICFPHLHFNLFSFFSSRRHNFGNCIKQRG